MLTRNHIYNKISSFFEQSILDIIFPKRCVECGKAGDFVCFDCVQKIEMMKTPTCCVCGKISKYGQFCASCKTKSGFELNGLFVAAHYDFGPTKEMIHHFKYSGFTSLAGSLSEMIFQCVHKNLPKGSFVIVPVPLHKDKEGLRGFNQAELIARELSIRLDIPGGCAISRIKNTETQVNLNKKLRQRNLEGAFACVDKELVAGKNILLIDDVATTLTTLNECAKILKEAGAKKVWGAVVARRI